MSWFRRKLRDPNACKVTYATYGSTFSEKRCSTHAVEWDDGGLCPHFGEPPYQSQQRRTDVEVPALEATAMVTFSVGGKQVEFVVVHATFAMGGDRMITAELQDRESWERARRWLG